MSDREYENTNRGALFRNEKKEKDSHPDYNGSLNVDGKEFWLDAWLKTSKAGKKYMSVSIKPKLQSDRGSPPTGGKNDRRSASDNHWPDDPSSSNRGGRW